MRFALNHPASLQTWQHNAKLGVLDICTCLMAALSGLKRSSGDAVSLCCRGLA